MGLDIGLVRFLGYYKDGSLNWQSHDDDRWDSSRYVIRKHMLQNMYYETLSSKRKWDMEEFYRPTDFPYARAWASSLQHEKDKEYVLNILNILEESEDLYLQYSY